MASASCAQRLMCALQWPGPDVRLTMATARRAFCNGASPGRAEPRKESRWDAKAIGPILVRAVRGRCLLWSARGRMCISKWPGPAVRFAVPRDTCTRCSGQGQMFAWQWPKSRVRSTMAAARCALDSGLCRVCALQWQGPSVRLAAYSADCVFHSVRARRIRWKGQSWRCAPGLDARCPMDTAGCVV